MAVGLLCSAVPYAADLVSLRRVTTRFFGVFSSINPALAAVAGLVVLHQVLPAHAWAGIGLVAAGVVVLALKR